MSSIHQKRPKHQGVEMALLEGPNGVAGRRHNGFLVHVEGGVDQRWHTGPAMTGRQQRVVERIGFRGDQLRTRRAVQMHDRGRLEFALAGQETNNDPNAHRCPNVVDR